MANIKTVGDLVDFLSQNFDRSDKIKITDPDATRDNELAVSSIDNVSVIDLNPKRDFDEQPDKLVIIHKNILVDFLPLEKEALIS